MLDGYRGPSNLKLRAWVGATADLLGWAHTATVYICCELPGADCIGTVSASLRYRWGVRGRLEFVAGIPCGTSGGLMPAIGVGFQWDPERSFDDVLWEAQKKLREFTLGKRCL